MAENKKSFILYTDQKGVWDKLDDAQAGRLIKHVISYVNDENPEAPDFITELAFEPIKAVLKRDLKKWETQQDQRKKAGKKSAEVRKRNATSVNDRSVSSTVNGSVSVNVSDNVNVINKKEGYFSNEKLNQCFSLWLKMCEEKGKNRPTTSIEAIVMKMQYKTTEQNITEVEQALENGWLNLYSIKPKTYEKKTEKPVYDAPQSVKKALNDLANKMKV